MSSRNAYLSAGERATAPSLYRVLSDCAGRIVRGGAIPQILEQGALALERTGFTLDYLEARHAETLAPLQARAQGPIRLLAAARVGKIRLIDNVAV
jgi:pantoate--beta-alanine ligase